MHFQLFALRGTPAIVLLALSLPIAPAHGADWRLSSETEAMHREARDETLRLRAPDDPYNLLDTRLAASVSSRGLYVRPELRQQGDSDWDISVPEAYYDANAGPLELSIGRKALQWDYGFFAAPLSWLGPSENQDHYTADPLVLAERFQGLQVWQAACTLRLSDQDELCLVRAEGFTGPGDWQVLLGYEDGLRLGAGVNWIATDRLGLRLSAAWDANSAVTAWQPGETTQGYLTEDPLVEQHQEQVTALAGATLSLDSGLELMLEHAWDSAALSASDWTDILQQVDQAGQQPEPQPGLGAQTIGWLAEAAAIQPPVAHRTLVRATQSWNDWDGEALATLLWTDEQPTWVSEIGPDYQWNDQASLGLRWRHYDGNGVLADLGNAFTLTLRVRTSGSIASR